MAKPKFEVEAKAKGNKAQLRIVGSLYEFTEANANDFEKQVDELLAQGVEDVHVYIRTKGGSTVEAFEIGNQILRFPGRKTGKCGSICASSGSYIAACLDYVEAVRNEAHMIHQPRLTASGTDEDLASAAKRVKDVKAAMLARYSKKSGKTEEYIQAKWTSDWWMTAEEAKVEGFIDAITDDTETVTADLADEIRAEHTELPEPIAALLPTKTNSKTENKMEKLPLVIAALQKGGVDIEPTAGEDAVIAAVQNLANEVGTLREENETMAASAKEAQENSAKEYVKAAHDAGKISKEEIPHYETLALENLDTVKAILDKVEPAKGISGRIKTPGTPSANADETLDYGKLMKEDPKALEKLQKEDPETFNEIKAAYKESLRQG